MVKVAVWVTDCPDVTLPNPRFGNVAVWERPVPLSAREVPTAGEAALTVRF